ncbi:beta-lactamase family protein [Thiotrichales bacterium 19S3-7]|nr:beta-lactamase family protein [Thiotrichales bacterium 19S3-7]MCF6800671.1 beta-lactamase family protein [Thiotrichales bacterium 19S3-11]
MRSTYHYKLILFIWLICSSFLVANEVSKQWLDSKVKAITQSTPVKGMIYGLWIDNKAVDINAVGLSMTKVKAKANMHFRIGGVTETMLTTLLMILDEQGKLKVEELVSEWYPNIPNANRITLKMLANGTSGIPDYVYNTKFIKDVTKAPFRYFSSEDLLTYAFLDKKSSFPPGSSQHYSHSDYVVLGNIIEKVMGQPLDILFDQYIFHKLKMKNSKFTLTASIYAPTLHSFSQDRPYSKDINQPVTDRIYEDSTFWSPSWTSSTGGVFSTIQDLGIWAHAWMNSSLISTESTQELRAPDTVGKGKNTKSRYFAMGFGVLNHWLMQNPSFNGYSGIFAVLPKKKIVFIAFNTVKKDTDTDKTGNLSMKLWREIAPKLAPEYPLPQ